MTEASMIDANFLTGSNGLIAIDKLGNQVLFLDPDSYETVLTLEGFATRVHELLIAPDRSIAYVRSTAMASMARTRIRDTSSRCSI
jgi:hypothetical protein